MITSNPTIVGGVSATSGIILIKAIINLGLALHWWTKDQANAWSDFTDVGLPILIVWGAAYYASKYTTPLDKPRDIDGVTLTRPDNSPAIAEIQNLQTEAIKIDKVKTQELTRGLN